MSYYDANKEVRNSDSVQEYIGLNPSSDISSYINFWGEIPYHLKISISFFCMRIIVPISKSGNEDLIIY